MHYGDRQPGAKEPPDEFASGPAGGYHCLSALPAERLMKAYGCVIALVLGMGPALASAGTPCDEVKASIAAKLDAKGVKDYALDVVATAEVADQKVVGSCEAGAKKIVYKRGGASTP